VDAPIAEGAVGVIEKLRQPPGWSLPLNGRNGAGPHHRSNPWIWAGRCWLRVFEAAAAVGEKADHADVADSAGFEEIHPADVMRADATMQADLDDAAGIARGFEHGAAFVDGVAGRFLDEDVARPL
jgi:hypothetical protein